MSISATIDPPVSKGLTGRARRSEAARPVKCQICGAVTRPGLDLGHQPVGDLILSPGQLNRPEIFYPMQVHHCAQCGLTYVGTGWKHGNGLQTYYACGGKISGNGKYALEGKRCPGKHCPGRRWCTCRR